MMLHLVGVVADDITGANDIGLMFAKNQLRTAVIPYSEPIDSSLFQELDAIILDTDSRLDPPEIAADKVRRATQALMRVGCRCYFNKTCSVFRGNIGAEFDAMQDVLSVNCSMIVLGFPKLGRTTLKGIHYLNGQPLHESPFINDPIHPTTESDLRKILARQSPRKSICFDYDALGKPFAEQQAMLAAMKAENAYVLFDVRHQDDLTKIARLIADEKNICGSSAIGEELPKFWPDSDRTERAAVKADATDCTGTLILAGSLTEPTKRQTAYLCQTGCPSAEFDPIRLLTEGGTVTDRLIDRAAETVSQGGRFFVYTSQSGIREAKLFAQQQGLDDAAFGKLISAAIGKIARETVAKTGLRRIVVAGGDTSMAVSAALSLVKMVILDEIEPGVPVMVGESRSARYSLVFKSGSFGSDSFLEKAINKIQ